MKILDSIKRLFGHEEPSVINPPLPAIRPGDMDVPPATNLNEIMARRYNRLPPTVPMLSRNAPSLRSSKVEAEEYRRPEDDFSSDRKGGHPSPCVAEPFGSSLMLRDGTKVCIERGEGAHNAHVWLVNKPAEKVQEDVFITTTVNDAILELQATRHQVESGGDRLSAYEAQVREIFNDARASLGLAPLGPAALTEALSEPVCVHCAGTGRSADARFADGCPDCDGTGKPAGVVAKFNLPRKRNP